MNLDINELLANILEELKVIAGDQWDDYKQTVTSIVENKKVRLGMLASFRMEGRITQEQFEERLEDEKLITESELHVIAIMKKVTAQRMANAVINAFKTAVQTAIDAVT